MYMLVWLLYKDKKILKTFKCLQGDGEVGTLMHCCWNAMWYCMGSNIVIPQKFERKLSHNLVIIFRRIQSREIGLYANVSRNFQDSHQPCIQRQMNQKRNVIDTFNEIVVRL